uniref:RING-type E3 ubiquitin transferase n=1 Tax=Anthurium amnicola TaxID=1678845 RepID=A0A1D1XYE4_9ARAE
MGSLCCCLHVEHSEDYAHPNSSIYRDCICFGCLAAQLLHAYTALFRREVRAIPSSVQGTSSSQEIASDSSIPDTYRAPPRPLPYDDPRCSPLHRDGLISRRDKASSHCHEESEPLRRSINEPDIESTCMSDKWSGSESQGQSKLCLSGSSFKHQSRDVTNIAAYIYTSSEDDDVCPTCLEEYISENPRITMQCSHHFHLGCIYEWMERSDACPVCGKVMVFNETT